MANWQNEFHEKYMDVAALRYGLREVELVKIGGFDNLVYTFKRNGSHYVLRVSHSSHRVPSQIQAELNWITYLADHEVQVCKPWPSARGEWLEMFESDNGTFLMTSFERAQGEHLDGNHRTWGSDLFEEWGYITGRMHACALSYELPINAPRRITYNDELPMESLDVSSTSKIEQTIYRKFWDSQKQILALPKSKEAYNLCHRDLHHGNFFVHDGKITAFDFDDSGYDYFVQDIAMAVFYASIFPTWRAPVKDTKQTTEFANQFLSHFMRGYRRSNRLDPFWIKQIPIFIEKRRCDLCLILFNKWGPEHQNLAQREWLQWNIESIENNMPCMDLDV